VERLRGGSKAWSLSGDEEHGIRGRLGTVSLLPTIDMNFPSKVDSSRTKLALLRTKVAFKNYSSKHMQVESSFKDLISKIQI
jgi:hypothetical protein